MRRWQTRTSVVLVGLLAPFTGCDCGDGLERLPTAHAELEHEDDVTPPLDRLEIAVGSQRIGDSVDIDVILRNTGDGALGVDAIALVADPELCPELSTAFQLVTDVSEVSSLAAGSEKTLTVRFAPQLGGTGCAVLDVATADEDNPRLTALFTGTGDAPRLCAERTLIDFGDVLVGDVANDAFTLTSCGSRAITLTSLTEEGSFPPFSTSGLSLPLTLEPDASVELPVSFSPEDIGPYTQAAGTEGSLLLLGEEGEAYVLIVEGTSVPPPSCNIVVVPAALNLGTVLDGATATGDIIVRNDGGADCTLNTASLDSGAAGFTVDLTPFTPGMTVAPNQTLVFGVTFTASQGNGVFQDWFRVTSDDVLEPEIAVALEANVPSNDGCQITVTPPTVDFGVVPPGVLRNREIVLTNISEDPCFLTGSSLAAGTHPGFIDTAANLGIIFPGNTKSLAVSFLGQAAPGPASGTLTIQTNDDDTPTFQVPLSAQSGPPGLCIDPLHVAFGETNTPAQLPVTLTACGTQTITVSGLDLTVTDPEFGLGAGAAVPVVLNPGDQHQVMVTYNPADDSPDYGVLTVTSNDLAYPSVDVEITGGPEIVPAEAGRYLYYWKIQGVGSDIVRLPLQGNIAATPYWGSSTGKGCTGCHRISPDGTYLAVLEVGTLKVIDTETDLPLDLGPNFADPTYFSWRPDVNTDPPYQFVYSDGADLKIGALFAGDLGVLPGADDPVLIETMPSWGPNGTIAFARGDQAVMTSNGGGSGLAGEVDLLVVDQAGGTPVPVPGASGNGAANYYPQFSPDGAWLAFTQSLSAQSTIAATDAKVLLVHPDGAGGVLGLANLNGAGGGANSFPTWSVDGSYLSFSSNRPGGAGDWDIYLSAIDLGTGADQAAMNLNDFGLGTLNTPAFEHAAQWSP